MNKFYNIPLDEQETIINIDYLNKKMHLYTNRKTIYTRYIKAIGEPTETYYINGQATGGKWTLSFNDKRINNMFSKTILIGGL